MNQLTRRGFLGMGAAALVRSSETRAVRPEYERTLAQALVCFPDASGDTDPQNLSRFLEAAYRDLSRILPFTRGLIAS